MRKPSPKGFTLIELLVVIAIIAILAAILFPVFASVRENARKIACTSNAKQFMLGILQYTQDNEETMPIAFAVNNSFGPYSAQVLGVPQTGVPAEIMPYIKSHDVFHCPDDNGGMQANGDGPTNGMTWAQESGHTYADVIGTSYKFTHQNFSNPYLAGSQGATDTGYTVSGTSGGSDVEWAGNNMPVTGQTFTTGTATTQTIGPVTIGMFQRPTETRVYADFPKRFQDKALKPGQVLFHPLGTTIAYVDGHVKFVTRNSVYMSGCDGVDWAWDFAGSCNTMGLQRQKD